MQSIIPLLWDHLRPVEVSTPAGVRFTISPVLSFGRREFLITRYGETVPARRVVLSLPELHSWATRLRYIRHNPEIVPGGINWRPRESSITAEDRELTARQNAAADFFTTHGA